MKYRYDGTITASLTREPRYSIAGHIEADDMIAAAKTLMPCIQDMCQAEHEAIAGFDHALEQCVELTLVISAIPLPPPPRTSTGIMPVETTRGT